MGQDASLPQGIEGIQVGNEAMASLMKKEGGGNENPEEVKKRLATIHMLYAASKERILSLADKLAASESTDVGDLRDSCNEIEVPRADSWDFRLGDWVRIKYSLSDFKVIQKKTLGWSARLRTIYGSDAVVTKRWSPYENGVTIYTPSRLSSSTIYGGVLEKIPENERVKDDSFKSQWKVNDYVVLLPKNTDKVLKLLQRGLDDIPNRYIGRRGRIIAVTRVAIVVTFNERTSYDINSALLTKSSDQSPLDLPVRTHERGFVLGQKVPVLRDVRKLINNQKGHGGWSVDMTDCCGKEVTIVHIRKDGGLFVQYATGRHWLMNPKSFEEHDEEELEIEEEESAALFSPGDVIKIQTIGNVRALMRTIQVPTDFLEYLRITAEVKMIDDDLDYMISYNSVQNVNVRAPYFRLATEDERSRHEAVKTKVADLKPGSSVYLDVGPPNFVKAVLRDSGTDPEIVKALTTPSVMKGFDGCGKAVLQYDNGKRYSVQKKYLTVPMKFNL